MFKKSINIKFRKKIILSVYFLLIFLIFLRYFYLQLIQYEKFSSEGESNSLRQFMLVAPRGLIFDRNEEFLVDNQLVYDINIIPKDFDPLSFNYDIILQELGINKGSLDSIVLPRKKNRIKQFLPVLIKRHVDFDVKAILEAANLSMSNVVDIMVFLTNMKDDFSRFNQIYAEYLDGFEVTRTTIEVGSLPTPISVEFKVVAQK